MRGCKVPRGFVAFSGSQNKSTQYTRTDTYTHSLTHKHTHTQAVQVIVQSRQGRKIATKSSSHGNEWVRINHCTVQIGVYWWHKQSQK